MSEEKYKLISTEQLEGAIEKGVETAFTKAGIDISAPFETQKDFAYLRGTRINAQDNMKMLRNALITKASQVGFVGICVAGWTWLIQNGGN